MHAPAYCALCGDAHPRPIQAYTARDEIDLVAPVSGQGLVLRHLEHIYLEAHCACGHHTRAAPGRCAPEEDWHVALTEWHLAGAGLVSFIGALALRQRMSRAHIQEFLHNWWGCR